MPLLTELEHIIFGLQATNISPLTGLGKDRAPRSASFHHHRGLPSAPWARPICGTALHNPQSPQGRHICSPAPHKNKKPRGDGIFGGSILGGFKDLCIGAGHEPKMPLLTELEHIIFGLQATNISPLTGLGKDRAPRSARRDNPITARHFNARDRLPRPQVPPGRLKCPKAPTILLIPITNVGEPY